MRLFVAIDIPDAVRDALTAVGRQLRQLCPNARWVRLEGAHLTLKFIGETPPDRAERVRSTLSAVRPCGPIELQFAGLGFFPGPGRPRVLWAGVRVSTALRELDASIETQLESLGIPRETREFSPHITLARFDSPKGLEPLHAAIEKLGTQEFGRTWARQFHLYQSVLKRGGAEYTRLASYDIAGEPAS
jgi:2'-5' RNA ligase